MSVEIVLRYERKTESKMKTPKEYANMISHHQISSDLLGDCIYSVNKRAKNYRDKAREKLRQYGRKADTSNEDMMKSKYYQQKSYLLNLLVPVSVHKVFAGYGKNRIYDYQKSFRKHERDNDFVWESCYYDNTREREVWFGDIEDRSLPVYRYYLFYQVGNHSFHSPINEDQIPEDIALVELDSLTTYSENPKHLLSTQFVNKVLYMVFTNDYHLTFHENASGYKCSQNELPPFIAIPKGQRVRKLSFETRVQAIHSFKDRDGEEIDIHEYLLREFNSRHGISKADTFLLAEKNGIETTNRSLKSDLLNMLKDRIDLLQIADQYGIGVTKSDYLMAGMTESYYKRHLKDLEVVGSFENKYGKYRVTIKLFSISQYLKWRNTGEL